MEEEFILEVRDLSVGYRGASILEAVTLQFVRGRIYAIIGPNGCGKTTLIRALTGSLKPERGEVLLNHHNIAQLKTKQIARQMAVVCQTNPAVQDMTVRTLVQYGRFAHRSWWRSSGNDDRRIVEEALQRTGLKVLENRRLDTLSGGERQRAWIAMAVAQSPKIMLLDEPTTYLDIAHQLEIMELLSRLNREEGITIVMVLHDINHAARYADELVVLKDRRIYKKGDPWQILQKEVFREVFRVEAEITRDRETQKPVFLARHVI